MPISLIDPTTSSIWQDLIQIHPYTNVFHSQEWLRVLAATYPFDLRAVVKTDSSGVAIAGLPYCIINDQRGKRIVTMPFQDFSDPLVETISDWNELLEPLLDEECPIITRLLHNDVPLSDPRFTLTSCAKWHGINLEPDIDTLWNGLDRTARGAIRKSQNMGIRVRVAEEGELRKFFNLQLRLRKYKHHLLAQPYVFFENIWKHLVQTGHGMIFLAECNGIEIGALFFFGWNDVFTCKYSASHQDELQYRPTDIMLWEAMQYGKKLGYKMLDLGLSGWDQEGLLRFKRKYASDEKTISFLRYNPPGYVEAEANLGPSLSRLTELFTRADVPDDITEEAGNLLYRFFT